MSKRVQFKGKVYELKNKRIWFFWSKKVWEALSGVSPIQEEHMFPFPRKEK